ncbi:MAG: hypothetical protein WC052_03550 [Patescibacteria group bacterium]
MSQLQDGYIFISGPVGYDGVVALAKPGAPEAWVHLLDGVTGAHVHRVEHLRELISGRLATRDKKGWTNASLLFAVEPNTDGKTGEIIPFAKFRRMLGV